MAVQPDFQVVPIDNGCYLVNDHGRTMAIITSQGYIDWLLRSPTEPGPLLTGIKKETHLEYTVGFKMMLVCPHLTDAVPIVGLSHRTEDAGKTLILIGDGHSKDGNFTSTTVARCAVNLANGRYEWDFVTDVTCRADKPVQLSWLEYNNVYPGKCGRCFLYAPHKQYHQTLMVDRDGAVWDFPHQHQMHYTRKISRLNFAEGSVAGFFDEPDGNPVVIVKRSSWEPDWAICDMYYDLHCGARPTGPVQPGQTLRFEYEVKYLSTAESEPLLSRARRVPVTAQDWADHDYPRLELGMNHLKSAVNIAGYDDASGFRQRPPVMVWDREVGHSEKGSLRISNAVAQETIWTAVPPSTVSNNNILRISAMARTRDVEGKGLFIRARYASFHWRPTTHVEWTQILTTTPVTGTTPGWVKITVPELVVPDEHFDHTIWIDVILEGKGTGWVTDIDVDLQPTKQSPDQLQSGSSARQRRSRPTRAKAPAGSGAPTA